MWNKIIKTFLVGYLDKTDVGRMTEDEIIDILNDEFERYTPADELTISFSYLDSEQDYIVYTVAYDRNGNRGELISKEYRTKSDFNQPMAYVSDVMYDNKYWYFTTTIGAYSSKYYKGVFTGTNGTTWSQYSDGIVAWVMDYLIETYPSDYAPVVQSADWQRSRNSNENYIQIVTWGVGQDGKKSGIIINKRYSISSSTSSKLASVQPSADRPQKKVDVLNTKVDFTNLKVYRVM